MGNGSRSPATRRRSSGLAMARRASTGGAGGAGRASAAEERRLEGELAAAETALGEAMARAEEAVRAADAAEAAHETLMRSGEYTTRARNASQRRADEAEAERERVVGESARATAARDHAWGALDVARGGSGLHLDYLQPGAEARATDLLGAGHVETLRAITAAQLGDTVEVDARGHNGLDVTRTSAEGGQARMTLERVGGADAARLRAPAGSLLARVEYVESGARTAGSGRDLVDAMRALRGAGVSRVYATAGGRYGAHLNGYDIWARLGGEGAIPPEVLGEAQRRFGPGVTRVEQLMATAEGRSFWRLHGQTFEVQLDLTPGGRTARRLDQLAARMAARGANEGEGG